MVRGGVAADLCPSPAFVTGTSTEYLGRKPHPRVLRERQTIFVVGPRGVGKSTVARMLAADAEQLDTRACQAAILARVRLGEWSSDIVDCPTLVMDGPVWLHNRPGALGLLRELVDLRSAAGHRTIICQADTDASVMLLLDRLPAGSCAVVALRFPRSPKARRRVAERICASHGVDAARAFGTAGLPNWSYAGVLSAVRR